MTNKIIETVGTSQSKKKKRASMNDPTNPDRQDVTVMVHRSEQWNQSFPFTGTLAEVIDALVEIQGSIPSEYWDNAQCEFGYDRGYEDSVTLSIEIYYTRPETDMEMKQRIVRRDNARNEEEKAERAMLYQLRRKYPDMENDLTEKDE